MSRGPGTLLGLTPDTSIFSRFTEKCKERLEVASPGSRLATTHRMRPQLPTSGFPSAASYLLRRKCTPRSSLRPQGRRRLRVCLTAPPQSSLPGTLPQGQCAEASAQQVSDRRPPETPAVDSPPGRTGDRAQHAGVKSPSRGEEGRGTRSGAGVESRPSRRERLTC